MLRFLLPALAAGAISFILTPVARWVSVWAGAIDQPDSRKIHGLPMPRLGGLAVLAAVLIVLATAFLEAPGLMPRLPRQLLLGFGLGLVPVFVVSVLDDIRGVRAHWRLAAQLLGALVSVHFGVVLNPSIHLFGQELFVGALAAPLSILWIVGVTNAFNLVDGLDGLSAGLALISATSLAAVFVAAREPGSAAAVLVLAGALAGFLPFNTQPASIFFGETGAACTGFVLACFALKGGSTLSAGFATLLPVIALGLPVAETLISIARRLLHRGDERPSGVFAADRNHIHHRLLALGLSHRGAVVVLYGVGAALSLVGLASLLVSYRHAAILLAALLVAALIGIQRLGYDEFAFIRKGTVLRLYDAPVFKRAFFAVFVDLFLIAVSFYVARGLKTDDWNLSRPDAEAITVVALLGLISAVTFWAFGLYRGAWKLASLDEFIRCAAAVVAASSATFVVLSGIAERRVTLSRFVLTTLVMLFLVCGSRVLYRVLQNQVWKASAAGQSALIYGAGLGGIAAARELVRNSEWRMQAAGFIDDDPKLKGRDVAGLPVIGSLDALEGMEGHVGPDAVVVSTAKIPEDRMERLLLLAKSRGFLVYRFDMRFDQVGTDAALTPSVAVLK